MIAGSAPTQVGNASAPTGCIGGQTSRRRRVAGVVARHVACAAPPSRARPPLARSRANGAGRLTARAAAATAAELRAGAHLLALAAVAESARAAARNGAAARERSRRHDACLAAAARVVHEGRVGHDGRVAHEGRVGRVCIGARAIRAAAVVRRRRGPVDAGGEREVGHRLARHHERRERGLHADLPRLHQKLPPIPSIAPSRDSTGRTRKFATVGRERDFAAPGAGAAGELSPGCKTK